MIQAAFVYVAPKCSPEKQNVVLPGEELTLNVVGCSSYDEAERIAIDLAGKGIDAIELCAGFGLEGVARIRKAVGPNLPVGVVRFDYHPALGFKSGDELF